MLGLDPRAAEVIARSTPPVIPPRKPAPTSSLDPVLPPKDPAQPLRMLANLVAAADPRYTLAADHNMRHRRMRNSPRVCGAIVNEATGLVSAEWVAAAAKADREVLRLEALAAENSYPTLTKRHTEARDALSAGNELTTAQTAILAQPLDISIEAGRVKARSAFVLQESVVKAQVKPLLDELLPKILALAEAEYEKLHEQMQAVRVRYRLPLEEVEEVEVAVFEAVGYLRSKINGGGLVGGGAVTVKRTLAGIGVDLVYPE